MSKKIRLGLFGLMGAVLAGASLIGGKANMVRAEDSQPEASSSVPVSSEPAAEVGHVIIEKGVNGDVVADVYDGKAGDVVTVMASADVLYKIEYIKMNGALLIEDSEIRGKYTFTMVAGDNIITSSFVIDGETAGGIANIINQIKAGDWTSVFSVETIMTIVKWILDGGVLIAFARYFIKNKKLEKAVENKVQSTITTIIPNQTKETVLKVTEEVITPIFAQVKADNADMKKAMAVFAKCFALSQDGSAESKKAIIDELATVGLSDTTTLAEVKAYIDNLMAEHEKTYKEAMERIERISAESKATIEEAKSESKAIESEDSNNYGTL